MASGEECLDGWVGAGGGEVKGGGVVFGVSSILLGEILRDIIGESGGEAFGVDGGGRLIIGGCISSSSKGGDLGGGLSLNFTLRESSTFMVTLFRMMYAFTVRRISEDLVCVVCLLLHDLIMNRGFLDAGGRNNNHRKKTTTDTGTCLALGSDGILNDATPHVDDAMKVVSPSVVEETVAMECPMVNTLGVGPNPPTPMQEANAPAGNAPGKPSYATATSKPSGKKVNVHTFFTPGGNRIDVVVLLDSIRAITERFANTV
ncbi:hypothetical protein Tco_1505946 [Tanacetum coccineum]